jgi:flotillin
MITTILGAVIVLVLVLFFLSTYRVVGTNEAHVIVFMGRGRSIKSPVIGVDGKKGKTAYFFIPFLMKRYIMPLANVKLDIDNIPLNDLEMAPFICDVVTWLHIEDPVKAAERLDFSTGNVFTSLHQDLIAIVQAIARAASMKQEILDIMRDRATFANGVSLEVDKVLESWGVSLVNLEVNDIRDEEGSSVIQNYEAIRKAAIQSKARIEVASRDREAVEAEQINRQKAETAKADSEKVFTTSQIDRDRVIGINTQEKEQQIAVAEAQTNETKIAALRVMTVGQAEVSKQAAIVEAEGRGEAIRITGEKEANVVSLTGKAQADAIEAKGLAEAKAKDAMAEALKKFNEAGISLEQIRANVEIQKAFATAYEAIAANAEIKVVTGGEGANILGLPMNAKTGADLGQMVEAFGGVEAIKGMFGKKEPKPETK